ncbi:hypothetical protein ACHAWF_013204 [Thalassiosira exigua]
MSPTSSPTGSLSTRPMKSATSLPTGSHMSSFSPAPVKSYGFLHKVVYGLITGDGRNSPVLLANLAKSHKVCCCSDTKKAGLVKKAKCDIWSNLYLLLCVAKTYAKEEENLRRKWRCTMIARAEVDSATTAITTGHLIPC